MLKSPLMRLTGLVLLSMIVALTVSCGGGSNSTDTGSPTITPTPNEALVPYFTQLVTIFQKASSDSADANSKLNDGLDAAGTNLDEEKAAMDTFLTSTAGVFNAAISSMNALDVPPLAKTDHDAFVAAATSSVQLASQLQNDLASVQTDTDAQDLINQFDTNYQPFLTAADTACANLQTLASANGVDVDLACQGSD